MAHSIGIIYVGIGEYIRFWDDFYTSCEMYFCTGCHKEYFLFTDSNLSITPENVHIFHQDDLGWPGNVLFRYQFILRVKEYLEDFDFTFFFNGNTRFRTEILEKEFLPTEEEGGLVALTWQNGTEDPDREYGFERRTSSVAYIPFGTKDLYLQSGITGGLTETYLQLVEDCHILTMKDLSNGIVPCAHDESIYNRYMLGRHFKQLDSTYGRASQRDKNNTAKIIFKRKEDVLGRSYLRKLKKRPHTNTWLRRLLRKINFVN